MEQLYINVIILPAMTDSVVTVTVYSFVPDYNTIYFHAMLLSRNKNRTRLVHFFFLFSFIQSDNFV